MILEYLQSFEQNAQIDLIRHINHDTERAIYHAIVADVGYIPSPDQLRARGQIRLVTAGSISSLEFQYDNETLVRRTITYATVHGEPDALTLRICHNAKIEFEFPKRPPQRPDLPPIDLSKHPAETKFITRNGLYMWLVGRSDEVPGEFTRDYYPQFWLSRQPRCARNRESVSYTVKQNGRRWNAGPTSPDDIVAVAP
jgi:hypothetical protein